MSDKITVEVSPDTLGVAYMYIKKKTIRFDTLTFKDGSIRVVIDDTDLSNYRYYKITAYLESMDDLMIVAQLKDVLDRLGEFVFKSLHITSPIYSRYDRVMLENKSDGFGSLVYANFINSLKFDNVILVDCHSEVLLSQVSNSLEITQAQTILGLFEGIPTIAPDKGALKKNPEASLVFNKVRDASTGKILGVEMLTTDLKEVDSFVVIDDLCEGGGTFLGVAQEFYEHYSKDVKLNLSVTHGLFTNNALPKLLEVFDNIYVYIMKEDVYNSQPEGIKNKLFPQILVK